MRSLLVIVCQVKELLVAIADSDVPVAVKTLETTKFTSHLTTLSESKEKLAATTLTEETASTLIDDAKKIHEAFKGDVKNWNKLIKMSW